MAAPRWLDDLRRSLFERGVPRADVWLTALAAIDFVALAIRRDLLLGARVEEAIVWFDRGVVAVFALDYLVNLARSPGKGAYVKSTWYDLIGMIPLPVALFRLFLLVRIPHAFVAGARDPAVAAKRGGSDYFLTVFRKYEPIIVEEVTDPVLVRLLQVLRDSIRNGRYLEAAGLALEERRARIHDVILQSLRESRAMRLALHAPPAEAAVRALADELTDVVVAALVNPEMDAVLIESLDATLARVQARFAAKDYAGPAAGVPPAVDPRG